MRHRDNFVRANIDSEVASDGTVLASTISTKFCQELRGKEWPRPTTNYPCSNDLLTYTRGKTDAPTIFPHKLSSIFQLYSSF